MRCQKAGKEQTEYPALQCGESRAKELPASQFVYNPQKNTRTSNQTICKHLEDNMAMSSS